MNEKRVARSTVFERANKDININKDKPKVNRKTPPTPELYERCMEIVDLVYFVDDLAYEEGNINEYTT